jgi:CzcA family heavy metal efflux pump
MIARIIQWSLGNRLFVVIGAALLLFWGGCETARMPVDVFPDLTAPQVTVLTEAHGMAPTEVEPLVTFPIETALNGAPGVRRVRSTTDVGISVVNVEFDWGTDIYQARQIVSEKMQLARGALPPDIPAPALAPIASVMGEILFIALTSKTHSTIELKSAADWVVRKRLLAVPGVAEVIPIGGDTKQFQVIVSPQRLGAYGIALDEVVQALKRSNRNASAGFYTEGGQEYLIHGLGRIGAPEDIAETVVARRGEVTVKVRDVAEVAIGAAPKRGIGAHSGAPAVILGIQKQPGANTLELTGRLDAVLADIQGSLPPGMEIQSRVFRQADFISTSIDTLALAEGGILVVVIVFAFLASMRASAITLLAIPLSLVAAVLAMKAFGATINTMTLGGMAIALGAVVDDAIIVVENIVRRLRDNLVRPPDERLEATRVVFAATREIQGSIDFATLIVMLVFLPLFFLAGVEGRLMVPLGFAYVVSLAVSLLVAITVTPVLASLLLPASKVVQRPEEPRLTHWLKTRYRSMLALSISHWKTITFASGVLLAGALLGLALAGRSFLPDFNEGSLTISAVNLAGNLAGRVGQAGAARRDHPPQ